MANTYDAFQRVKVSNLKIKHDHGNEIFHKLREVRIAKGITQHALAFMIGCHPHEINRWERRKNLPSADTFIAWLQVLGFTIVAPENEEPTNYEI